MNASFLRKQLDDTLHMLRHRVTKATLVLTAAYMGLTQAHGIDYVNLLSGAAKAAQYIASDSSPQSTATPGEAGKVDVAFSPNDGALPLVLKVINSSSVSLDIMAYSFTSVDVTRAVLAAHKRGVRVRVLADEKQNTSSPGSKYAQSALSSLANAGAEIRLIGEFAIFHDKVIISDKKTVQTGSFNYSKAAAQSNSENVLVLWGNQSVAVKYQNHFDNRWRMSSRYSPR